MRPAIRYPTFSETRDDARAAGWPAVVDADACAADLADLDRLDAAVNRERAGAQSEIAKVPEFKRLTATSRGNGALRRLALSTMQGFVWQLRQPHPNWSRINTASSLAQALLKRKLLAGASADESADYLAKVLRLAAAEPETHAGHVAMWSPAIVANAVAYVDAGYVLSEEMTSLLRGLHTKMQNAAYRPQDMRRAMESLDRVLAQSSPGSAEVGLPTLRAGEPWADAATADLSSLDTPQRSAWAEMLRHAPTCNAAKASVKWLERTNALMKPIGGEAFVAHVDRWLSKLATAGTAGRQVVHRGDTYNNVPSDASQDVLVGLAWALSTLKDAPPAMRVLADLAEVCYRPIPRFGPRCVKVGGAAVRALASAGTLDAVGQLARLELRVRTPKGRKLIQKVLAEAIAASGLSRQDVEETSVPDFGLRDGTLSIPVGEWHAEIDATDAYDPTLTWRKPDGAVAKSCAAIKKTMPDQVESAQRTLKDVEGMLPAQRTRLELLLRDTRTWRLDQWRARYLHHGLLSPMVRRLIWTIDGTPVTFAGGDKSTDIAATDVNGESVTFADSAEVAIWHPVGRTADEVVAWRRRLETLRVSQPFKQAHREVYLVTDAELNTRTYSNRFAAHIVKTPTLIAIGQTRKWKVSLYGHATIDLPQFGLRAEYWSNVAGNADGGGDGGGDGHPTYGYGPSYLATDQVRFYRGQDLDPMPVADVPPLPFSEVMRDCDLFVGIASIGADPNWTDGGVNGRYRDYWHSFSFGELGESAKTRRAVLERLIPRLKIAGVCSLADKFLRVKGQLRAYKIHLGSGNILMEPNDQYLCIVPARGAAAAGFTGEPGSVFLPFEGDTTMSVILSKAFLLADDAGITDETITRQIGRPRSPQGQ